MALCTGTAAVPRPGARPKLTPTDAAGAAPLRAIHCDTRDGRPGRSDVAVARDTRARRIAGHEGQQRDAHEDARDPDADHPDVEGEAGVRVRLAGEADDAERREQHGDPAGEDRRRDRDDRGPKGRERDQLSRRHPERPQRAVVPGLDPDLAGDGLLHQHQEGEEHDDPEDPECRRLHPDRPLHPGLLGGPGRDECDRLVAGQLLDFPLERRQIRRPALELRVEQRALHDLVVPALVEGPREVDHR